MKSFFLTILFVFPVIFFSGLKASEPDIYNKQFFDSLDINLVKGDSSILDFINKNLAVSQESSDSLAVAYYRYLKGKYNIVNSANMGEAYKELFIASAIFEKYGNDLMFAKCEMQIGVIYYLFRDFNQAKDHFERAFNLILQINDSVRICRLAYLLGITYSENKDFKNSRKYLKIAEKYSSYNEDSWLDHAYGMGIYYLNMESADSALIYLNDAYKIVADDIALNGSDERSIATLQNYQSKIAQAWWLKGNYKKAEELCMNIIQLGKRPNTEFAFKTSYRLLNDLAKRRNDYRIAEECLMKYVGISDSIHSDKKVFEVAALATQLNLEKQRQINKQEELNLQKQIDWEKRLKFLFLSIALLILIFVVFLIRNNIEKKKTNKILADSLEKLKETQEQLIHHEKLASMGRLSAGLAHEMRNPLNFVNGFSEVTAEMVDQIENAASEQERKAIIASVKNNIYKIGEHGKRAEIIVKQFIEHVHSSKGNREPNDINELCDMYLKIALHTYSIGEKTFHYEIAKKYSTDVPFFKINPQEFGRVLISIFSNAFLAMEEKLLHVSFVPNLNISTGYENGSIKIKITDNGIGIKKEFLPKIGEPFFTTRSPGKGAGLGLSVAHDIVRSYGGQLIAESVAMQFTTITITLPVQQA